jgi:hypothetical protein
VLYFRKYSRRILIPLAGLAFHGQLLADGSNIDKVYHPYVQPLEKEIELRAQYQSDAEQQRDDTQRFRLGYGQSVNDSWFAEIYMIGEKSRDENSSIDKVELEALWQITEQGEYAADWGMLFEYERGLNENVNALAAAILTERQWGHWVGTANLSLEYEWGSYVKSEAETALALQGKYRYSLALEPAVEFYSNQGGQGLGPVLLGRQRLAPGKQLRWEAGVIYGLDSDAADRTYKLTLEFEF